ncbi:GspH/FimT family pseudopilin [Nocardioides sp. URHA0032]|uniref:GspH/FimT family pseudopilin n=1 Tax=Nocardioides sp. URHA0032 TaxID=1380388 RepID=UPI00048D8ABF|nr:GspH/FimT family pseudopilin [Nocardioides sp. URHA0032]
MRATTRDDGFTLIEVMVVIVIFGVLMAITVTRYDQWQAASDQSGTANEIEALLRSTHQRAITDGAALCVLFDTTADEYAVRQGGCASPGAVVDGPRDVAGSGTHLASPTFTGSGGDGVVFYARGTATGGSLKVTRDGSDKTYTVHVEQLTGRVTVS